MDIIVVDKDGTEYSLRAACAIVYARTGQLIDNKAHDADLQLQSLGFKVQQGRKAFWRKLRHKVKKSIRKYLLKIGSWEVYFR